MDSDDQLWEDMRLREVVLVICAALVGVALVVELAVVTWQSTAP